MTLSQAQLLGLNKMIAMNTGTLAYSGSTVSCYKSAYKDNNYSMDNTGLMGDFDNLFVMARTSEVGSWNLEPYTKEVTLDGTPYMTGRTITVNGPATTIWLRKKR